MFIADLSLFGVYGPNSCHDHAINHQSNHGTCLGMDFHKVLFGVRGTFKKRQIVSIEFLVPVTIVIIPDVLGTNLITKAY